MTRLTKLDRLKGFLQGAPKLNIAKMENVLQNYREGIVDTLNGTFGAPALVFN